MTGQMRMAAKQVMEELAVGESHGRRSMDLKSASWSPLPETRREAETISRLLTKDETRTYLGQEALEEVFKALESPGVLHMATHGFFLEEEDKSELYEQEDDIRGITIMERPSLGSDLKIENPLLRSGLVLAGANRLAQEEMTESTEDGILTALEISGMNLWGTDLVVLSACETGVGETRRGEGVFGLRRAFQLAGAKTVVMSLWKVPDRETRELMEDFYKRLRKGEGKTQALQNAQLAMIESRKKKHGASHPFFWGAFVCVGDPE
jgi:CHAT domain-containing protein